MVDRVTNQAMQSNALNNIFRITEELGKTNSQISSNKRISKGSDDPSGWRIALQMRASVQQVNQHIRNIDFNQLMLGAGDGALGSIGTSLIRAKELGVAQLNGVGTPQTRQYAGAEVDKLISLVLQSANTNVKGQYIFSGTKAATSPFSVSASGAEYSGSSDNLQLEIASGYKVSLALPGSQVLGTDLNPALSSSTSLSSLNAGAGVPAGSFVINDQTGNSATINVTAGMTVGNVLSAINGAGLNVAASINSGQKGILLASTSTVISQALTVTEAGSGTTAANLGILGQRDGNFDGKDLNPALAAGTALSQLNGGNGLSLTSVNIVNGSASGTVTMSSAATIGEVINQINNSGLNVTASINGQGNALRVTSNSASTVAVVSEAGSGTSAQDLGIGGGRNVLTSLINLRDALNKNDQNAILAVLRNLDGSLSSVNSGRAAIGATLAQLKSIHDSNDRDVVALNEQIGNVEDTDFVSATAHLAQLQTALQATLIATSRIIQPSILDFLR